MPMNVKNISEKVMAYLADPENEDEIAREIALEVARVTAPLIVKDMASTVMPPPEPEDDKPHRHENAQPPDEREPEHKPGPRQPEFHERDERPPRGG